MKDNRTLFQLTSDMVELEDALYESGGELTPEIEEALALTSDALMAKVDGYNSVIRKMKAHSEACADEIKRIQAIKKTADNGQKRIREFIDYSMGIYDIKRIDGEFCKITRSTRSVLEVNEEMVLETVKDILAECRESLPPFVKIEAKIDKTALKEWMNEQQITLPGCEWKESSSITIR